MTDDAVDAGRRMARDFRQTAGRVRNLGGLCSDEEAAMWDVRAKVVEGMLPPDDDGEPVTAEWCQANGWTDNCDRSYTVCRAGLVEVVWYQKGVAAEHFSQLCLYLYPQPGILTRQADATRGELRRLCAALGQPLKEGTK